MNTTMRDHVLDALAASDECWPGWNRDPEQVRDLMLRIAAYAYRQGVADAASTTRFNGGWED